MRTRLRALRIDDRTYVWTARISHTVHSVDCRRFARLRVWSGGKNGQALQADLVSTYEGGPWGYCATDTSYPTPRDVRAVIELAIQRGWDPLARGGTFLLRGGDSPSAPGLADFEIADSLLP
ncbi:hypothetical protein GCM10010412_027520 [Nonomuraea recticatena]|uniref:Integrase n=1 Tax=Nonomuraea recticatena TaxID=46178 RepID=A0ABN3RNJ2_9ACTN